MLRVRVAPDRRYIVDVLQRLVRINSVNPRLDPRAPGESEIVAYLEEVMGDLGLESTVHEFEPKRPSITGRLSGNGRGRSLMLNAHVDTVGVAGMSEPFSGALRDGRVHGRGSYDMKGSMAACLGAVKALQTAGLRLGGDLVVAGVADEEYGSLGTAGLIPVCPVDGAIVTEPTALRTCLAHKGYVWLRIETQGRAAHGSRFDEGIDANLMMGSILHELAVLEQTLRESEPHPLVGPPSIHAPLLKGGTGISTYADRCVLQVERRTIPGETVADVEAQLEEVLARAGAGQDNFRAIVESFFIRQPFEVRPDADIVKAVDRASAKHLGVSRPHIGDTPWMDAALLAEAGVETVVIGPAGKGAHSAEEWVDVDSVVTLAAILADAALEYCGV